MSICSLHRRPACLIPLFLFLSFHLFAVDKIERMELDPNPKNPPGTFDMLSNLPRNWETWVRRSFTKENVPIILATMSVSAITLITDYQSWQITKAPYERIPIFRKVSDIGVLLGDGGPQFGVAAIFASYGWIDSNNRALRTGSQLAEVILSTALVVQSLKHATGRESPTAAETKTGRWRWFPSPYKYHKRVSKYDAVPSGHIATSLATMTVIIENYPEYTWLRYVGYPIVGVIGVGLVSSSIHWWSDIPLGMVIGYSMSQVVLHPDKTDASIAGATGFKPRVMIVSARELSDDGMGLVPALGLNWRF